MKKLLVIVLLASFVGGCGTGENSESECPPIPSAIDINAIELIVNQGEYQANTLVPYQQVYISFQTTGAGVYSAGNEFDENKTYAQNCIIPPEIVPANNKLIAINIYSTADFSTELTAGSSLNNVFNVHGVVFNNNQDPITAKTVQELLPITIARDFSLTLNQAPEFEGSHIFYIDISLDNGKQFSLATPELLLAK